MNDICKSVLKEDIKKVKIGFSIELTVLFDNIYSDFDRIIDLLKRNKNLLGNQSFVVLESNIQSFSELLSNFLDILLLDTDKTEKYVDYLAKFY